MSDHIGDANKMVSDTPRTDVATWHTKTPGDPIGSDVVCQSFAEALERELNAAHERIKRLEEAGDEILRDNQDMANVNRWWRAKEAKP